MGIFNAIDQVLGTDKSSDAIAAQQAAAAQADATLKQVYDQQRSDEQPYMQAGYGALKSMQDPSFQHSFTMADFNQDPGYQFAMQQGQQAIERSAAAKGLQMSGATLKDLTNYGQGMGAQQYQAAYDRFNNDQNLRFGRLSTIAGMGQNAIAGAGQAAENYGNNASQVQMGLGNAEGAAQIASGNAAANMISQGVTAGVLFCDERLKCDIRPVSKEDMAELKRTIRPYFFKYKNPEKHGQGEYLGVMTQDLKKSRLGASLVTEDGEGNECIDLHRLLMLFLASQAEG